MAVSFPYLEAERPVYLAEQLGIVRTKRASGDVWGSSTARAEANEILTRLEAEEALFAAAVSTEIMVETQERLAKAILKEEVSSLQLVEAGYRPAGSTEGLGVMADVDTVQTMRAAGGIQIPEGLKTMLPLLLIFAVVLLIIFKK